jgi:hypothetical protein
LSTISRISATLSFAFFVDFVDDLRVDFVDRRGDFVAFFEAEGFVLVDFVDGAAVVAAVSAFG